MDSANNLPTPLRSLTNSRVIINIIHKLISERNQPKEERYIKIIVRNRILQ